MPLLKMIAPEDASGDMAKRYAAFQDTIGMVPKPYEMFSISPGLLEVMTQQIQYYQNHPNLGFPLLTLIRYFTALEYNYPACIDFNAHLMKMQGMTEEDIRTLESNPDSAPLEDKDKAMLRFVLQAIRSPESVAKEDVDSLLGLGWTESDIFDAVHHGTYMYGPSVLMKVFKIYP